MGESKGEGQESWMEKAAGALPQEEVDPETYVRTTGAPGFKATASSLHFQLKDLITRVAHVLLPVQHTEHGAEPAGQREPAK